MFSNSKWEALLVVTGLGGGELDDGVERNAEVRAFILRLAHQVSIEGAEHGLVSDDEDRGAQAFEFDDDRFKALDHIRVGFTSRVSV